MERFSQLKKIPMFCLVCGVDSGPIKTFLYSFIGSLFLASVCFMFWGLSTKRFDDKEDLASFPIEKEKESK